MRVEILTKKARKKVGEGSLEWTEYVGSREIDRGEIYLTRWPCVVPDPGVNLREGEYVFRPLLHEEDR